ncbi:CPBP family intramembrane glutamic endopeptidase [Oligoflexus tunisiensis]|uniref:CPBP family intramembrane glutamic endopeptidase n=1 Tax=Oligoflexus tunisiensis TaxID=708132 RepID=UPI001C40707D|nr:CPBP family intramembrane glutamic endopeptidase [Oligoflexus tunisiensis]
MLWVGLHPFLRFVVYPHWELKPFLRSMEIVSATLLLLQVLSLTALHDWRRRCGSPGPWYRALGLLPVIWLLNTLVLWLFMEFHLIPEPLLEPLYDSQLFIRRFPFSWTALSFLLSAILEEIFFRAWLPDFLGRRLKKSAAVLLSAGMFALAHLAPHTSAQALLAYLLFALSLSYVRSFHGIGAAIGVHLLNNLLAFGSQVFSFNIFTQIGAQKGLFYSVLLLLGLGLYWVGRDLVRLVDKGASAPH